MKLTELEIDKLAEEKIYTHDCNNPHALRVVDNRRIGFVLGFQSCQEQSKESNAVEFHKWLHKNYWTSTIDPSIYWYPNKNVHMGNRFTVEQLYEIFKLKG
jgi:hypothetical protein